MVQMIAQLTLHGYTIVRCSLADDVVMFVGQLGTAEDCLTSFNVMRTYISGAHSH